jgi:hypothetical protein
VKASKRERERNPYFLTGKGKRKSRCRTVQEVDALAARSLLMSLGLGFGAYVALLLTTIPPWTNFTRESWLTIALISFGSAVAFLCKALAGFGLNHSSRSDEVQTVTSAPGLRKNRSYGKRTNVSR